MKKITYIIILLVIIAGGVMLYITRPVDAPTLEESRVASGTNNDQNGEGTTVYTIDQLQTTAEFTLGEDLRDEPFTVVGTTQSVFGELIINTENLELSTLGTIKIDARTLKTDSEKRDGAIARLILNSEKAENNFITFKPTGVATIPADARVDTNYNFKVMGDLTISGVTKQVTFDTNAKLTTAGNIEGVATTVVKRGDFNLIIPNIPFVTNVDENVDLKLSFVMKAK